MRVFLSPLLLPILMLASSCQSANTPGLLVHADQTVLSSPPRFSADATRLALPYVEVEAETTRSSGSWSTTSTALHTPGAEASGRRYVILEAGQRVVFDAPIDGDSLVVRYSFPDSADGAGRGGALKIFVGTNPAVLLPVTSKYSWEYGIPAWNMTNVWNQPPSAGLPRHFWDEANLRAVPYTVGTPVVVANPADSGVTVLIDLVDFEKVPLAVPPPRGASFFSADTTGVTDVTAQLQALVDSGGTIYIPEGTYQIGSISVGSATLQGAGLWRTRFCGPSAQFRFTGGVARVADFAVFGGTNTRNDNSDVGNGFAGVPASGSTLDRIWVEHMKCAFWFGNWNNSLGPTGITLTACRFRDTMADAVNLCSGTTNTVVQDCLIRNTGDDGLAAWSPHLGTNPAGGNNSFLRNLVQAPWVANGIVVYGGGPFVIEGNEVKDTVTTGSGIYVSATFSSWPFTGSSMVKNNLLIRTGAHESDRGGPTGAIRILAGEQDMGGGSFQFTDNTVVAPLESAVSIQGPNNVGALTFNGLTANNLGSAVLVDVRSNAKGSAVFTGVATPDSANPVWRNSADANFTLVH